MDYKVCYECPTQVKFWESEKNDYMGGIAYRDEIICGGCGAVILISDVIDNTPKGTNPIIDYENWVDIQAEIIGE